METAHLLEEVRLKIETLQAQIAASPKSKVVNEINATLWAERLKTVMQQEKTENRKPSTDNR